MHWYAVNRSADNAERGSALTVAIAVRAVRV